MPGVFGVLQSADHGLGRSGFRGKFVLAQARILSHLSHQQSKINLVQSAHYRITVACLLSRKQLNEIPASIALGGLSHRMAPLRNVLFTLRPVRRISSPRSNQAVGGGAG